MKGRQSWLSRVTLRFLPLLVNMKRFFTVVTVLLLLIIGTITGLSLWLGRDSAAQIRLLETLVYKSTGLVLTLEQPSIDLAEGTLSASRLALSPPENPNQPHINVQSLALSIHRGESGQGLLASTLTATAVTVFASDKGESVNPSPKQWVNYLSYLPDQLQINIFHIISAQDTTQVISASDITGHRHSAQQYDLQLRYHHGKQPLQIHASVTDKSHRDDKSELHGSASVSADDFSHAELSGSVQGDDREFNYQLAMSAYIPELGNYRDVIAGQSGIPLAGGLTASGVLEGDNTAFLIKNARFSLQNLPNYAFQASGSVHYSFDGSNQLNLDATGQLGNPTLLHQWIDTDLSGLGEVRATVNLGGSLQALRANHFTLSTFADNGLQLSLKGEALADTDIKTPSDTKSGFTAHRARLTAQGPKLALLEPWVGQLPLELGAWRLSGNIQQNDTGIALSQLELSAGNKNSLYVTGDNGRLVVDTTSDTDNATVTSAYLPLDAHAASVASLTPLVDIDKNAPYASIGSIDANAVLQHNAKTWSLEEINAQINEPRIKLQAKGKISELTRTPKTTLTLSIDRFKPELLAVEFAPEIASTIRHSSILGSAVIKAYQHTISLTDIDLHVTDIDQSQINISGNAMIQDAPTGELTLQFSSSNAVFLERLSGQSIAKTHGEINTHIAADKVLLTGNINFNKSAFQIESELHTKDRELLGVRVSIDSDTVWLNDIGFASQQNNSVQNNDDPVLHLSEYLDKAPEIPVDLKINLGTVHGATSQLDGLTLHLDASDKRYLLRDFTVRYGDATGELRGIIDHNGSSPFVSVAVDARQIALGKLLSDMGMGSPVDGALSLRGGLSALGDTPNALLNALDGSLSIALEKALIQGAAYDMLATDILAWLYTGASQQDNTFVDCAMAQITLTQGVASTDTIFVESPNMIATGKGSINFHSDDINFRITPYSKSRRLQVPATVKIRGTLANPEVNPSVAKAAMDATAEALSLLPKLLFKAFGADKYDVKARPCEPAG